MDYIAFVYPRYPQHRCNANGSAAWVFCRKAPPTCLEYRYVSSMLLCLKNCKRHVSQVNKAHTPVSHIFQRHRMPISSGMDVLFVPYDVGHQGMGTAFGTGVTSLVTLCGALSTACRGLQEEDVHTSERYTLYGLDIAEDTCTDTFRGMAVRTMDFEQRYHRHTCAADTSCYGAGNFKNRLTKATLSRELVSSSHLKEGQSSTPLAFPYWHLLRQGCNTAQAPRTRQQPICAR